MGLLAILAIVLILAVISIAVVGLVIGGAGLLLFGDVIVFAIIVTCIVKLFSKKRKKRA